MASLHFPALRLTAALLVLALVAGCGGGNESGTDSSNVSEAPAAAPSVNDKAVDTRERQAVSIAAVGSLSATVSAATTAANLTTAGSADWARWGYGSAVPGLVRKATGGSQISTYTLVGGGTPVAYDGSPRALSWTDGAPIAASASNRNGLYLDGGGGFSMVVPAGTAARTVTVYVGGWNAGGTLTARLSDSSAADYSDVTAAVPDGFFRTYTIAYQAAAANQTLTLTWVRSSGTGLVLLEAVTLTGAAATNQAPVVTAPAAQNSVQGVALTLAVAASDANGDTLSYSATGLPAGLTINAATGIVSGTPTTVATSTPTITASDGQGNSGSASFVWSVRAAAAGGALSAMVSTSTASVTLGTAAHADWAHWGDGVPGLVRKAGGGSQIGAYTLVQPATVSGYNNDLRAFSWTGGTPIATSTNSTRGVRVSGNGRGFSVTVPAGIASRTVTIHVGGGTSSARLRAHLSDNSQPDYVNTTAYASTRYVRAYTLTYNAASEGQQLVLSWTQVSGFGNVTLKAVALGAASVANRPPVITTPAAQNSTQGVAATLALAASDPDGNALSFAASGLPAGLAINAASGVISGTPTTVASYTPVVTVADGLGGSAVASFAWAVQAAPPPSPLSGLDSRPSNTTCLAPARPQAGTGARLARVFPNLTFSQPVGMVQAPGVGGRWYVIEQGSGLVRSFPDDQAATATSVATVLNLSARIQGGSEMGLLGLALHPQWPATPQAFVYYSVAGTSPVENRVSRFTSSNGGATLDLASEQVVLRLIKNQGDTNHNGGHVAFGPDGYLYVGTGDGGGGGDPNNNAQNRNVLFGKMLRLDVSPASGYAIPGGATGNPFAGNAQCTNGTGAAPCPEIFAHGLRNPWRWSFDRSTGDLWAGDVGQGAREEVNVVRRGANYGWDVREASLCHSPSSGCGTTGAGGEPLIDPLVEYGRDAGSAVTGGFVYRGTKVPALAGRYVFADYGSSRVFSFAPPAGLQAATPRVVLTAGDALFTAPQNVTSFAEGNDGELYVVGYGGQLFGLQVASAPIDNVATLLSQTGCVAADRTLPAAGLIPYNTNASFWSDGAIKQRWLAVPNGSIIAPHATASWNPPNGSVLMKHFRLAGQLIETRLLMRHPDGIWAGYTYEWNLAQTDATRVSTGKTKAIAGQNWIYPSENDCMQCHTQVAGRVLGLETAQLNGNLTYPQTGRTANQVTTLNTIGILSPAIAGTPASLPAYVDPHGTAGTLEQRARAFLHVNCAQCHQPSGPTPVPLDLRYTTPLALTGACNTTPTEGDLGLPNARLIAPGAPDSSVLLSRTNRRDTFAMPPLGSNLVDTQSVAMLRQWIQGLTGCQ